jgi:hypothetical protein
MQRMPFVPRAVFFQLDAGCVVLFIFFRRVIAPLAFSAFKRHGKTIFFLCHGYPKSPKRQNVQAANLWLAGLRALLFGLFDS